MTSKYVRAARLAVLVVMLLVVAGCAQERAPISRVQADALEKRFFVEELANRDDDPEFFMRVSVVDVPSGAGSDGLFTNSDAQPMTRIRWEITETLLVARLTYERIDGTDGKGVRRTPDGQVVAAYRIVKHFDIKRDYNPSTGEELNVLVENDFDRPWYERSHFRVDWSANLVTTAYELDTLSQLGMWYGVKWEPLAYYVNDPGHPDAPVFDAKRGYFDVTNKAFAAPQVLTDEWGDFPACWLYGSWPEVSCNPSEVTLRQSYLRVVDTDYEPLDYDGARMEMFGYFTVDRFGYDRSYGVVDNRWRRFAARWNLYQRSHADPPIACNTPETTPVGADPHRDEDASGTEDECEAIGRGSRCDAVVGLCTIPLRDRTLRSIPWHVSRGFPEDYFETTREALKAWSDALRVAVVAGRLVECERSGEADCRATLGWPARWADDWVPPVGNSAPGEVPEIFVLCHNPVDSAQGDDPAICGEDGTSPRIGDLRYNLVTMVNEPQVMSPWGIMMDAEDPLTGEKIAGSVTQWGSVLDRAAASVADIVSLLNGGISPESFIAGQDVSDWVGANKPNGHAQAGAPMSAEELSARRAAFDPEQLAPYLDGIGSAKPGAPPGLRHAVRAKALVDQGRLGPGNAVLANRTRALRGTAIEAKLVGSELLQAAGFDPTVTPSPEAIRRASPFGTMSVQARRELRRKRLLSGARRHACRLDGPDPDNLLGLARTAAQRFPAPDPSDKAAVNDHRKTVSSWVRGELNRGIMAHEIGHSVGLRHNFAASFDSLNYDAGYWQLRTDNGAVTADCPPGNTDGSSCVGPRWRDPLTDAEISGGIQRYATSSVMDYPGDPSQDMLLPGKYDRAAARFAYGGVVDVWSKPGVSVDASGDGQREAYRLSAFTSNPGLFGVYYFPPPNVNLPWEFIHYSQYPTTFGLLEDCQPSDAADAVGGIKCAEREMDVVDYRDMKDFASDPEYAKFAWAVNARAVDGAGRVRRGYLFSSDEYADTGNVPSFSYDAGADAYEQIRFLESGYENRYVLDAFRRNRVTFNSWDVTSRVQYRYLDAIQLITKTFAFGALLDGDPAAPSSQLLQDGYYGPLQLGSTLALDLFARILTRPEPGYYCPPEYCGGAQPPGVKTPIFVADWAPLPEFYLYDFRVALGDGRYLHNDYDYSQGYWWADYQTQVGAYYDKIWATYYLTEAFDFFISNSKEDFTDSRYKNVSFATIFPEQVRRLYASLLTGDLDSFAPWVVVPASSSDTPLGTLQYPRWYDPKDTGTRPATALSADPNYAWNAQLYAMVWGSVYLPTNWSSSWLHDARIAALPSETPDWPADETYVFRHPPSGMTYRAHSAGTDQVLGQTRQKGTGARMLEWANQLLALAYLVETDGSGQVVENADGSPVLLLDAAGKPQKNPANPGAAAALQKYVDTIDLFRQITAFFEQPLGDYDLPHP
jgi:hypothetical protein